jgi:pectin methylesterase-like acyl-CoA thioesterase
VTVAVSLLGTDNLNAASYNITVAKDGSGNYTTVQAAINAVPNNQTSWYTIYIKNGTYTEVVSISSSKTYLYLIGESKDGVKITYNNSSSSAGGTSASATVTNSAKNFKAENISFINSFDYDNSSVTNKQGVALLAQADRQIYQNCNFLGHQDTLYVNSGRQYFNNCYIQGVVDFIFGNGTSVFNNCTINCHYRSGGTGCITAPSTLASSTYGLVFIGCNVTADSSVSSGGFSLGRPWHPSSSTASLSSSTVYLNCALASACGTWTDMSGVSWTGERFYEYKNTGSGASTSRPQLTASQAANYTVSNILKGSDSWVPDTSTTSATTSSSTATATSTAVTTSSSSATATPVPSTTASTGSVVHNFTTSGKTSSFFTIVGNLSTSKGTITYNGLTLTQCLKIESSTSITFTTTAAKTLTLVFNSASSTNIKVDGTTYTLTNGIATVSLAAGSHTITKANTGNLYYMSLN